jgi:hypothetical protein
MRRVQARHELAKDILFILIGVIIAFLLSESGVFDEMLSFLGSSPVIIFLTGIFFTSVFTIAPASVAFAHIAQATPVPVVALWGALGALCGDLILFFFIRDKFAVDLERAFKPSLVKHILHSFHFGFIKWISPIIGALIIASPLPDELGLTLMGLSKTRLIVLIPISFVMNMVGIYALVWVVQAL